MGFRVTPRIVCDFDLLGQVTNAFVHLVYHSGRLRSAEATHLLHLHDYLIDSDKRGFGFTPRAWNKVKKRHGITDMALPAHSRFTAKVPSSSRSHARAQDEPQPKLSNITDQVYFAVIYPIFDGVIAQVKDIASRSLEQGP